MYGFDDAKNREKIKEVEVPFSGTFEITTSNEISYTDMHSQQVKSYWVDVPGLYDYIKNNDISTIKFKQNSSAEETYSSGSFYIQKGKETDPRHYILIAGSAAYKYYIFVYSGEESGTQDPGGISKKDRVEFVYSIIITGGQQYMESGKSYPISISFE